MQAHRVLRPVDDAVEVRRGPVGGATSEPGEQGPEQFLWRGRLWKVHSVLARSVEGGGPHVRELWRVEAGRGAGPRDVVELACAVREGRWRLVGIDLGGRG